MSKLHERKVKHRNMNLQEKMACNCEMCKGLNVDKMKRKSNVPEIKIENLVNKINDINTE